MTGLETLPHCRHNLALKTVFDHLCTVLEKARLLKKWLPKAGNMNRLGIVVIVIAGLGVAGLVALSSWDIPAPTVAINKVVSDDTLPK